MTAGLERAPSFFVSLRRNTVSPTAPRRSSRESVPARDADVQGGKGWRRKRRPASNRPDRVRSPQGPITRRESGQTSVGSFMAREEGGFLMSVGSVKSPPSGK
uniref:Uncharacterized protein n=1 Tax=Leptospirillum ferrodiazotrophum TaxID=412449 RepID=C6HTM3_9BACT|nr:MAG: conserved hypothetical protein [Leptospirillum ferrodiazotrophum]